MRNPSSAIKRRAVAVRADRVGQSRDDLYEILDAGLIAHVAWIADGCPVVLPMGYARDGEFLLLHGSSKNHMLRALAAGGELCATISLLDGLVLASTAFTHSMNYRSVVIYGRATAIEDPPAKAKALDHFVEVLLPGRTHELPESTRQELQATLVLSVPLDEVSVKSRSGPPKPAARTAGRLPWIGIIPLELRRGTPEPALTGGSALSTPPPRSMPEKPRSALARPRC